MDKTLNLILQVLISIDCDLKTIAVTNDPNLTTEQKINLLESINNQTEKIIDIIN